jgi:hypothetical protein
MTVLAIDPGYELSAFVRYDGERIVDHGIEANALLLDRVAREDDAHVTLEAIESYGMAVGREVFETVFWTGRLFEAATRRGADVFRLPRKTIKAPSVRHGSSAGLQSSRGADRSVRRQ